MTPIPATVSAVRSWPAAGATGVVSGPDVQRLHRRYPPRVVPSTWPGTCQDRDRLIARVLAPPFTDPAMWVRRRRGVVSVVDWLADHPGRTWQERWQASGADALGNADWWRPSIEMLQSGSQRREVGIGDQQPASQLAFAGRRRRDPP